MADYYPLIARAVTGLDKRTGEARRALYERARTALVTQLRGVEPALSEADITRERLALEEAIRKVEAEAARRPRQESPESPRANAVPPPPRPSAFAPAPPPPPPPEVRSAETPPPDWEELRRELNGLEPSPQPESMEAPERNAPEPPPQPGAEEPSRPFEADSRPDLAEPAPPADGAPPEAPAPSRNKRFPGRRTSLVDEGLKGFRDVIAETDDLGDATASASRSAREKREAFAGLPPSNEIERIEPRFKPEELRRTEQEHPPSPSRPEPRAGARARPVPPPPAPDEFEEPQSQPRRQPLRPRLGGGARRIIGFAVVLVLAAAAFFAYREWGGSIAGMIQSARSPAVQASKEAPQARPKISDRIGGAQQDSARPARNAGAAVAQRAVLYEQQADPQERKQYVGSVIWRTETSSPGPGQPADLAVKAEVEIPERHMRMSFTMRRNLDQSLPASHTIEILFSTPADFQPGGIADVPGVLMEDTEQRSGTPLTGLRVKVTSGFFLVGLSSVENDVRRNVQLLKERAWLHLRMAYNNGQRALLAIEKGVPGDRVFEEALNAWGQTPPPQSQR
ncbi:MAG TPA: hypothetical protein VFK79_06385 [Xanthobacteraceae bacterium]|nr:hypothetical protein [Xanthobacteraceae bacterium]